MPEITRSNNTTHAYVQSVSTTGLYMYLPSSGRGLFDLLKCELYTDCPYATQVWVLARWKDSAGAWRGDALFKGYVDAVFGWVMPKEREVIGPFQIYCYIPSINTTTYNVNLIAEWRRKDVRQDEVVDTSSWWG